MEFQGKPGPIQESEADIKVLDLFQRFHTEQEFLDKFGVEPPEYVPAWSKKHWADPDALKAKGANILYEVLESDEEGRIVKGDDGLPIVTMLSVPKQIAARVNIQPQIVPVEDRFRFPTMPMPIRKLVAPEKLAFSLLNAPVVRNETVYQTTLNDTDSFTKADRDLLRKIAAKLGV